MPKLAKNELKNPNRPVMSKNIKILAVLPFKKLGLYPFTIKSYKAL